MDVPLFFRVSLVAQMLGQVSEKFVRDELRRGKFFPLSPTGQPDTSSVVRVGDCDMVSLAGVNWYLHVHCTWPHVATASAVLARSLSGVAEVVALPGVEDGVAARSPGELRRRMANG